MVGRASCCDRVAVNSEHTEQVRLVPIYQTVRQRCKELECVLLKPVLRVTCVYTHTHIVIRSQIAVMSACLNAEPALGMGEVGPRLGGAPRFGAAV